MCNHYESKMCDCLGGVCGLFQTSEDYYYNLAQQNSVTAVKEKHERVEKLRDELAELINKKELEYFEMIKTDYIHLALLDMKFDKCKDGKYRRTQIHDSINVVLDDFGCLWINAEIYNEHVEIQITMFKFNELDKFKQWLILTDGA